MVDQEDIKSYIADSFPGVDVQVASADNGAPEIAWGDTFFIYDPNRGLPETRRFPFATSSPRTTRDSTSSPRSTVRAFFA